MDRDINGVLNILRIAESELANTGRPLAYRRPSKKSEHQEDSNELQDDPFAEPVNPVPAKKPRRRRQFLAGRETGLSC